MSKINVLSSKVYNRIAAGEVVERPASVVKELVENSIDAGATEITVEIENGGISSVKITDNGSGIEKSELKKAVMPHATSKISKVEDLDNIFSLGFRGEALASIASVSKLTIVSKPSAQQEGARLYTEGGEDIEISEYPSADGTEITVNNLFFNTPARERFLKPSKSEENEITATIARFILGNPDIAFKYLANGKVVYQSYGDGEEAAFVSVYGVKTLQDCFYIDTEKNGIIIKGYIGKHHFTKPNRTYQSVFLNGRFIVNSTVSAAVMNAYGAYLMKRQYPFYSLTIKMPPDAVDVNVHPNKIDVRFINNQIVYGAVYSVVANVLDGRAEVLNIVSEKETLKPKEIKEEIKANYVRHNEDYKTFLHTNPSFNKVILKDSGKKAETEFKFNDSSECKTAVDIFAENKAYLEKLEREKNEKEKETPTSAVQQEIAITRELRYIGQALNTFLIFDDGLDIYFIDQHAAHERILFDKFNEQIKNRKIDTQILLLPYIFDVDFNEYEFLHNSLDILNSMGIDITEFGEYTFKVSALPVILADVNLKEFFDDISYDLSNLKKIGLTEVLKEKIAKKACKAAIKSGDRLSDDDITSIMLKIQEDLGLKCPHGRPVAVKISRTEIDKWFKRIV